MSTVTHQTKSEIRVPHAVAVECGAQRGGRRLGRQPEHADARSSGGARRRRRMPWTVSLPDKALTTGEFV
ncbi:hypothetical protein ACFW9O_34055 [Streptomyces sp. NPDC059499]|uniref:hypothetical protein n=1 Tax=Streptomyces sp. NPDC059499 TaxID=3346852 RepID=UPI003676D495